MAVALKIESATVRDLRSVTDNENTEFYDDIDKETLFNVDLSHQDLKPIMLISSELALIRIQQVCACIQQMHLS